MQIRNTISASIQCNLELSSFIPPWVTPDIIGAAYPANSNCRLFRSWKRQRSNIKIFVLFLTKLIIIMSNNYLVLFGLHFVFNVRGVCRVHCSLLWEVTHLPTRWCLIVTEEHCAHLWCHRISLLQCVWRIVKRTCLSHSVILWFKC